MERRKILSVFGFFVWRSFNSGRWVASSANKAYYSTNLDKLVEQIVPEPPDMLNAETIRSWAKKCLTACVSDQPDPAELARAAFAAYFIDPPPDEFIKLFVEALE